MTRIDRSVMFNSLVLSLVLYSSWIQICYNSKVIPAEIAPKSFNKCEACNDLANRLYNQYDCKRKDLQKKYEQKPEKCYTEVSEIVCNLAQVVEQRLKGLERDLKGQCDSKSKTIEKSCLPKVIGKGNPMGAAVYVCGTNPTKEMSLVNHHMCQDNTEACSVWHDVSDLKGQCDSESKTIEESCLQKVIGAGDPNTTAVYVCGNNPKEMSDLHDHLCTQTCPRQKTSEEKDKKKVNLKQGFKNMKQGFKNMCKSIAGFFGKKRVNDCLELDMNYM